MFCEIYFAFPVTVFNFEQLLQIIVLLSQVCPEVLHEVADVNESIEVVVEGKERLPDILTFSCHLALNLCVEGLDSVRDNLRLFRLVRRVLPFQLFGIPVFIGLSLLLEDVELGEENLPELVKTHAIGRHSVLHCAHHGHIVEQVEHLETQLHVLTTVTDAVHDGRLKNVRLDDVALAMKVHVAEGLLWPAVHVLEVVAEGLLDLLREMMPAVAVLELGSVAVMLLAWIT